MNTCYGMVYCASGFMLPQLEDPKVGFGISKEDGSWFGRYINHIPIQFTNHTHFSKYYDHWKLHWGSPWRVSKSKVWKTQVLVI